MLSPTQRCLSDGAMYDFVVIAPENFHIVLRADQKQPKLGVDEGKPLILTL